MKVDQFSGGHTDFPVTFGLVTVASRETHRGHSPFCAIQDRRATTAGICEKKKSDNMEKLNVSREKTGVSDLSGFDSHQHCCKCPCG